MSAIGWIVNNKEWVFSGIGVTGLIGIFYLAVALIRKAYSKKTGTVIATARSGAEAPANQMPSPITKISSISAKSIRNAIESAPPLQQADIAKRYEGILVQWHARLFTAIDEGNGKVRLALDFPDSMAVVFCAVVLKEYAVLGVLNRGAPITVIGRISRVVPGINLTDVELFFNEPPAHGSAP